MAKKITTNSKLTSIYNLARKYSTFVGNTYMENYFCVLKEKREIYQSSRELDDLEILMLYCVRGFHQHRMPWKNTVLAVEKLVDSDILNRQFNSFEELYLFVSDLFTNIPFARGPLTTYDTALHIGQLFTPVIEPKEYVYFGDHVKSVIKAINGTAPQNINVNIKSFPQSMSFLGSMHLENYLCIFGNLIKSFCSGIQIKINVSVEVNKHINKITGPIKIDPSFLNKYTNAKTNNN